MRSQQQQALSTVWTGKHQPVTWRRGIMRLCVAFCACSPPYVCRSAEQADHIAKLLKQLESTGQLDDLDLTGSTWRLLYSTSKGSSSGKIGPFIGRVTQVLFRVG